MEALHGATPLAGKLIYWRGLLAVLTSLMLAVTLAVWRVPSTVSAMVHGQQQAPSSASAPAPAGEGAPDQVSAIGSFTHSVPIQVPAFHGLEPSLSLDYDSAQGNGEIGVGWRLRAGSTIVRSGPEGALPGYDANDVFFVDGDELVHCAPNCTTGGTHETRAQSHERFVFDGEEWTRWRRDGVRLHYTATPDGPGADAYQWSLTDQTDPHGNVVRFDWGCPNHCLLQSITYAAATEDCGGSGQDPCKSGAAVWFHYELRPDIVAYPTGRGHRQVRQRLRTIEVRMDGGLVAAYKLSYEVSPLSGNSVLHTVQHFPSDATVGPDGTVTAGSTPPLPPITFTAESAGQPEPRWTADAIPAATVPSGLPSISSYPEVSSTLPGNIRKVPTDLDPGDLRASPLYGDFDGDHRVDAASWKVTLSGCSTLYVRLTGRADLAETPDAGCYSGGFATDLNGDGADDIVTMAGAGEFRRLLSNRDGTFTEQPSGTSAPWAGMKGSRKCAAGDVNGDQLGDIACIYGTIATGLHVGVLRTSQDGGFVPFDAPLPPNVPGIGNVVFALGDVDNSRTSDVMLAIGPVSLPAKPFELLTGFTNENGDIRSWATTPTSWSVAPSTESWTLVPADVDGDARADYVLVGEGSAVRVGLSRKGAAPPIVPLPEMTAAGQNVTIGDADGDGRADVMTGEPARVQRSNGDGTFAGANELTTSRVADCRLSDGCATAAADANGDGQADLLFATTVIQSGRATSFKLRTQPSPVAPPVQYRWTPFDYNGDGRKDLYTMQYRNPGYELYVLTAKPAGGYQQETPFAIQPTTGGPALDNPDAGGWLAMDVTGPGGNPDGRSDLVLVGRAGGALQVTTLVSGDIGWTIQRCAQTSCLTGTDAPDATDLRAWRPSRLNSDERADLVRFMSRGTGVRVEYLLAQATGSWLAGHEDHFTAGTPADGGALTRPDVGTFRTADLNREMVETTSYMWRWGGPPRLSAISSALCSPTVLPCGERSSAAGSNRCPPRPRTG